MPSTAHQSCPCFVITMLVTMLYLSNKMTYLNQHFMPITPCFLITKLLKKFIRLAQHNYFNKEI